LINPDDSLALKRIINTPARQIGKSTVDQCEQIAIQHQTTFSYVALNIDSYVDQLKPAAVTKLKMFRHMVQEMLNNLTLQTPAQLLENITKGTRYEEHLIKTDGKDNAEEKM